MAIVFLQQKKSSLMVTKSNDITFAVEFQHEHEESSDFLSYCNKEFATTSYILRQNNISTNSLDGKQINCDIFINMLWRHQFVAKDDLSCLTFCNELNHCKKSKFKTQAFALYFSPSPDALPSSLLICEFLARRTSSLCQLAAAPSPHRLP